MQQSGGSAPIPGPEGTGESTGQRTGPPEMPFQQFPFRKRFAFHAMRVVRSVAHQMILNFVCGGIPMPMAFSRRSARLQRGAASLGLAE
jgi:hypothetical protein